MKLSFLRKNRAIFGSILRINLARNGSYKLLDLYGMRLGSATSLTSSGNKKMSLEIFSKFL